HWDGDRLAQAVGNLITNALHYSPPQSSVRVETRGEGAQVTVAVHNDGEPIPAERLPHVFEPMQRAASEVNKAGRSVGLGLYIVRHLIEAHEGTVSVESSHGRGTTFTLTLPRSAKALT
ncbi:MAG TPA: ATP-binding protein, partial [Myxococcaceae bacterium]|nr:ATP-binding protein [Myxococcaceae bacterium]